MGNGINGVGLCGVLRPGCVWWFFMPDFMRAVTFHTDLFTSEANRSRSEKALTLFLQTLTSLDCDYLQDFPRTPALYESGVVYEEEPFGYESWKSIPRVLQARKGDCEDLACWRAAELRMKAGIAAVPFFTRRQMGNTVLYHILVRLPNGRVEDPSRRLGMK